MGYDIDTEPRSGSLRIGPLRLDRLRVAIGLEQPQHSVDMGEVHPALI